MTDKISRVKVLVILKILFSALMKMVVGVQFSLAGKCMYLSFNTQIKNMEKIYFFVQSFALWR